MQYDDIVLCATEWKNMLYGLLRRNNPGTVCRISESNADTNIVQNRHHSYGQYAIPSCQNRETGAG